MIPIIIFSIMPKGITKAMGTGNNKIIFMYSNSSFQGENVFVIILLYF